MRQFLRCSAFASLLLLSACQTGGASRAGGSGAASLPGNYLRLGDTVLDDADDLKDLANQVGSVAAAADMCRLPTDMMDKEVHELSGLIPDFGSALPKGFFAHTYLTARKNIAAKAERGGCDANSRQGIERIYADLVINLQSPHLRSWIRALPR